jgi:hypothetical protein
MLSAPPRPALASYPLSSQISHHSAVFIKLFTFDTAYRIEFETLSKYFLFLITDCQDLLKRRLSLQTSLLTVDIDVTRSRTE